VSGARGSARPPVWRAVASRLRSGALVGIGALGIVHAGMSAVVAARTAARPWEASSRERADLHLLTRDDLPWAMPRLLESVPRDAELLVVTESLLAWPIAMYAAPRRTRLLAQANERLLAQTLEPTVRDLLERRIAHLEREDCRFTPDRFRRDLARSTHLLVIAPAPADLAADGVERELLHAVGDPARPAAAIWRIVR